MVGLVRFELYQPTPQLAINQWKAKGVAQDAHRKHTRRTGIRCRTNTHGRRTVWQTAITPTTHPQGMAV